MKALCDFVEIPKEVIDRVQAKSTCDHYPAWAQQVLTVYVGQARFTLLVCAGCAEAAKK